MVELANMLSLLWFVPLCVFLQGAVFVCSELVCQRCLSACSKVYSSTDPLRLPECLLRCPGTVPAADPAALHGLSMASGERHGILDRLPSLPTHMLLVMAHLASEEVDLWILLSRYLFWFRCIRHEQCP